MASGWLVDNTLLDGPKPCIYRQYKVNLVDYFLKSKEGHGVWRRWGAGVRHGVWRRWGGAGEGAGGDYD